MASKKYKYTLRAGKVYITIPRSAGGNGKPKPIKIKGVLPYKIVGCKKGENTYVINKVITDHVAKMCNITPPEAVKIIDALRRVMSAALARGERIKIHHFGTFIVKRKPARNVYSFHTKQLEMKPARNWVKFKPYALYREALEKAPIKDESQP